MNPSDSPRSPLRFRFLIRTGWCSSSITARGLQHCTVYLPQHAIPATPEDPKDRFRSQGLWAPAFPKRPPGRRLHRHHEATSRFTRVTACCFANWKLTTPCYQDAAPLSYRGVRTTPRTGL